MTPVNVVSFKGIHRFIAKTLRQSLLSVSKERIPPLQKGTLMILEAPTFLVSVP